MLHMFMNTANAVMQSLDIFWKGMLAICVVIAVCITVTLVMSHLDRAAEEKKKKKEQDGETQ